MGVVSPNANYDELITGTSAVVFHGGPYVFGRDAFQPTPGELAVPIGVAAMPKGPAHNGTVFNADAWMLMGTSENQEAAWEWLKFIAPHTVIGALMSPIAGDINQSFREHMIAIRDGEHSPEGALTKIHQEVTAKLNEIK